MAARGGKATAGNGECWKNHHDDIAEAQTNSHRRPWSIGYPQGLTRQGWAAPKAGNCGGRPTQNERPTCSRGLRGLHVGGLSKFDRQSQDDNGIVGFLRQLGEGEIAAEELSDA